MTILANSHVSATVIRPTADALISNQHDDYLVLIEGGLAVSALQNFLPRAAIVDLSTTFEEMGPFTVGTAVATWRDILQRRASDACGRSIGRSQGMPSDVTLT